MTTYVCFTSSAAAAAAATRDANHTCLRKQSTAYSPYICRTPRLNTGPRPAERCAPLLHFAFAPLHMKNRLGCYD